TVAAYQPTNPTGRIQLVTQGTTGTTGVVNLTLWPAVFTLRSSATGFATVESSVDVSATSSTTVTLAGTSVLFGHVRDPDLVPLNADSTLPGLDPPGLRNLRLQIDATLGNGDGTLSAGEITAFQNWLTAKGPGYVTTDGFFTTNSRSYNSTLSSFALSLSNTLGTPNAKVWINTTAQYKIKGAPPYIANGGKTYFVNLTMIPDKNVSVYQDYLYFVSFPK